jgi:8-oxo-dGTP diphosphatase
MFCYDYMMDTPCFYRVSVKGVVIDGQGRILLAREANGMWEMIGGGLDHGEDPIACLRREISEETGLNVTGISERPKFFLTAPSKSGSHFTANIIYQIELEDLDFTPSEECQELRFFSVEEMTQVELFPNVQKLYELLTAAL